MVLKKFEYFVSVVNNMSFTKAAAECYVAQAAISQQIRKYEDELGFDLFIRENHTIRLTKAGEFMYHQVSGILAEYNASVEQARKLATESNPSLVIGVPGLYEHWVISQKVSAFHRAHPEVDIEFVQGHKLELFNMLLHGKADVIIALSYDFDYQKNRNLIMEHVAYDEVLLIMSASHKLAGKQIVIPEELEDDNFIVYNDNDFSTSNSRVENYYSNLGFDIKKFKYTKSIYDMLLKVESGLGVSSIPATLRDKIGSNFAFAQIEGMGRIIDTVALRLSSSVNPYAVDFFRTLNSFNIKEKK